MSPFFNRIDAFERVASGYHGQRLMKKLTKFEQAFAREFIADRHQLDAGAFEQEVNRYFVDNSARREAVPQWLIVMELLSMTNTAARTGK